MAENFINKTFGQNVKIPVKTLKQFEKTAQGSVNNIFEPLFNFIDDNQNIFTGNVANEIEKYTLMTYNINALLKKGQTSSGFNVSG